MGFVLTKGQFITIDVPFAGSSYAQANDISAKGSIVGIWVMLTAFPTVFWRKEQSSPVSNIRFSGYHGVGQMVGNWFDTDGNAHGWAATPGDKRKASVVFPGNCAPPVAGELALQRTRTLHKRKSGPRVPAQSEFLKFRDRQIGINPV